MVSFDRLVEKARLHALERGEVGIEQDLVAAYEEDAALDALDLDDNPPAFACSVSHEPKSTEGDGLR
jgi:hypothetical protein